MGRQPPTVHTVTPAGPIQSPLARPSYHPPIIHPHLQPYFPQPKFHYPNLNYPQPIMPPPSHPEPEQTARRSEKRRLSASTPSHPEADQSRGFPHPEQMARPSQKRRLSISPSHEAADPSRSSNLPRPEQTARRSQKRRPKADRPESQRKKRARVGSYLEYECRSKGCNRQFAEKLVRNQHEKAHTNPILFVDLLHYLVLKTDILAISQWMYNSRMRKSFWWCMALSLFLNWSCWYPHAGRWTNKTLNAWFVFDSMRSTVKLSDFLNFRHPPEDPTKYASGSGSRWA